MSIGVYDSGVGGLTVYRAIAARFEKLDMIYFGDSARVPYGNKSPETIVRYGRECSRYLVSRHNLSALVVACNTISSHALPVLREELGIPVIGVIAPGAAHAVASTVNNRIGVLGTHATVTSNAYPAAIEAAADKPVEVFQQACPLFVPLAEEALLEGEVAETVVTETLKDIKNKNVDTLILGCTHYPLLKPLIKRAMPEAAIVDSTEYIIKDIEALGIPLREEGQRKIYVTDQSHAFYSLKNLLVGEVPVEIVKL